MNTNWNEVFGYEVRAAAIVAMAEEARQTLEEFLAAQYKALRDENTAGWDEEPSAEQLASWAAQIAAEAEAEAE